MNPEKIKDYFIIIIIIIIIDCLLQANDANKKVWSMAY